VSRPDPRFHLAWFMNFSNPPWNGQWSGQDGANWPDGRFFVDFAQALERACFDYMMLEDSSMVSDQYEGSSRVDLKYGLYAPKHDPVMLVPALAAATRHLGIVATCSTSFYPPATLARRFHTLDHLSGGRVGWNIVTSSEDRAAQNFGLPKLYEHDQRYEMADEYVGAVERYWAAAPEGAADPLPTVRADGPFFQVEATVPGPRSPQGRPIYCQAGGSPRGKRFAGEHTDTLLTGAGTGNESMRRFREDIRAHAAAAGRDPDSVKVLFITSPILGDTLEEAHAKRRAMEAAVDSRIESTLGHIGALTDNDLSGIPLDEPFGELETNGHRTTLNDFMSFGDTPRKAALGWSMKNVRFVGTPDSVAEEMGEAMAEVGGDGFLISGGITRRYLAEITDGLVPALQRRGLVRSSYDHTTLRENLMQF
jgi:FMN-dependent oxidoreductase (nitrilotriacetate monooxygenase family)